MLEIRTLEEKNLEELADLFNYGFQEYMIPMQVTAQRVETMIQTQDLRMDLSIEGIKDGQSVGFCWLGVRGDQVWVGGIGVGPEYRNQGYGRVLLSHCIDQARKLGYAEFLLECIQENERALHLYASLGLRATNELYNLRNNQPAPFVAAVQGIRVIEGTEVDLVRYWEQFHQVPKSWQGDLPTLQDGFSNKEIRLLERDGEILGMMLYVEEANIVLQDLAVQGEDKKLCQILLAELHQQGKPILAYFVPEPSVVAATLIEAGYERFIDQVQMSMALR